MSEIRMTVMQRAGRPFFECQWLDPVTEKWRTKTTKADNRRDAERFSAKLLVQLESGEQGPRRNTTWAEFVKKLKTDFFPGLEKTSQCKIQGTLNLIEDRIDPGRIVGLREAQISEIVAHLRELGRSEYTIRGHLANLRNILGWAVRQKLLAKSPHVEMPPEPAESDRGRPITGEEFDRKKNAVAGVVGEQNAAGWIRMLDGLWLSGFRLGEAHKFHWTDQSKITPDLTGRKPLLRIQAKSQKAKVFTLMPMTPDFARWLLETPKPDRHGYVFNPIDKRGRRASEENCGKTISAIGEAAGIKVGEGKFSSAHDLRRAFGLRWASKVRAAILMQLMRHASIATTLKFYAHADAQAAADELWRDETNTSTNTSVSGAHSVDQHSVENASKPGKSQRPRQESNL